MQQVSGVGFHHETIQEFTRATWGVSTIKDAGLLVFSYEGRCRANDVMS